MTRILWPGFRRLKLRSGPGPLTREAVLDALRRLAVRVPGFSPWDFDELGLHLALERYLGMEIGLQWIPDRESAIMRHITSRSTTHGQLVYVPDKRAVVMQFPTRLSESDRKDAHYEELAHIIAAHPVPYRPREDRPDLYEFWQPPRQKVLSRRRPPFCLRACRTDTDLRREMLRWCEADAARWVEHLRTIAAMGRQRYLTEERIIGL